MELLLWRWSTAAQITSAAMIAVFFAVLMRSVRRVELRPWVNAWVANLGALMVTVVFWMAQPEEAAMLILSRGAYAFCKTLFVILLVRGALRFVPQRSATIRYRAILIAAAIAGLVIGFGAQSVDHLGIAQSAIIGISLAAGAVLLVANGVPAAGWLLTGFTIRAALAFIETIAYTSHLVTLSWSSEAATGIFLAAHSSFDTAAEWMIALGSVLMLYRTIQQELTQSNSELLAAKDVLQDLVDRDSLTGLANRRALPMILREAYASGATVLFFDLNDFKEINDSYGHHAGDECLKRFARALQASFRPDDHVVRYAGDEFVVVAPGAAPEQILARVDQVRDRLKFEANTPHVRFSVGHAWLAPGGQPDDALREADQAMYRDKRKKTVRLRSV